MPLHAEYRFQHGISFLSLTQIVSRKIPREFLLSNLDYLLFHRHFTNRGQNYTYFLESQEKFSRIIRAARAICTLSVSFKVST